MAVGLIGTQSALTTSSQTLAIARPQPSEQYNVLLAFLSVLSTTTNYPTISGQGGDGWQQVASRQVTAQRTVAVFAKQLTDWEPSSYQFTTSGTLGSGYCFSGVILGFTNACAVVQHSNAAYTTSDTIVRAGGLWLTDYNSVVAYLGYANRQFAAGPSGWDVRSLNLGDAATTSWACVATKGYLTPVSTGSIDATLVSATTAKHAFLVEVFQLPLPPRDLIISAPADGAVIAPGTIVNLTAIATDPNGANIKYDFGTDKFWVGQTGYIASGQPGTVSWNTTGAYGPYLLSCWATNVYGSLCGKVSINIVLAHALIVRPADGAYHVPGKVQLVARGYLPAPGQVRVQWELDTNDPPNSSSPDYQLLTSPAADQGAETATLGECNSVGTWYYRARTLDSLNNPSPWTPTHALHVLEGVRLLPGSVIERSTLQAANKVIVKVDKADPPIVVSAVSNEGELAYSKSPREVSIVAPEGTDEAGALAIATKQLARRREEQTTYSGLKVALAGGLKLRRGQRVRLQIARLDFDATATVRELAFDIKADECAVTLGEFWSPQDRW